MEEALNDSEFKNLEKILEIVPTREKMDLLLLVQDRRPACLFMDPSEKVKQLLQQFSEKTGLSLRFYESSDSSLGKSACVLSRSSDRFKLIENSSGRFYGLEDGDVGRLLGFPEDDIEYFKSEIENGPLEPETREKGRELVDQGVLNHSDLRYLELVTYVPRPRKENIVEAIETGKEYRSALMEFDESNDSEMGRRCLEEYFNSLEFFDQSHS